MEQKDKKICNKNFFDAFKNAFNGLTYATATQKNIRKQLFIGIAVLILSLFYKLETTHLLCLIFAIFLVIFAEMINTAIEAVVDLYTDLYHPKAKVAKDVGAGAVLLMAINSIIVAYLIFLKETSIIESLKMLFQTILGSPMLVVLAIIIIAIVLILLCVINRIGYNKEKSKVNCIAEVLFGILMMILIVLMIIGLCVA